MRSCLWLLLLLGCAQPPDPAGPVTLGVGVRNLAGEDGAVLEALTEDGPAARAGLRPGDRLLTLDGTAVDGACTFDHLLLARRPGQTVALTVRRGGEILEKSVQLVGALAFGEKACAAGRAAGCFELGLLYVRGRGVPADPARANQLFQQACDAGSAAACAELGGRYLHGYGGAAYDARIVTLLRRACDGGSASGCAHLAFLYATGRGVVQDDERALRLYQAACDGGDAAGCYNVGLHFEKARGTSENSSLALLAYGRACDQGYALACTNLAFLHEGGLGVPQGPEELAEVTELYRRACLGSPCEAGDPLGCFNLGVFYRDGKGVAQDKAQAAAFFERSCAGNNAFGCANLADLLYAGDGVPRDEKRAAELFRQACAGGHSFSCRNVVAIAVQAGNTDQAADAMGRLERACDEGKAGACRELGTIYDEGVGVAPDRVRARALFRRACEGGDDESCARL
jgi:uncharacterized protein